MNIGGVTTNYPIGNEARKTQSATLQNNFANVGLKNLLNSEKYITL